MAATPTVYVICDQNCKFEGMTKEQILTAIAQAVATGEIKDVDTGFVTTIKTINGIPLKFFVGEQSAYDALTDEEKINLYAIITNDATLSGITEAIKKLQNDLKELTEGLLSGDIVVKNAESAKTLRYGSLANGTNLNDITTFGDYIRSGSSHLITIYNSPTAHAFYMQVTSSGAGIRQEITTYDNNNPKKYYRTYYMYDGIGGWGDWVEILTDKSINDKFGRKTLWSDVKLLIGINDPYMITSSEKSLNIGVALKYKKLVVELTKFTMKEGLIFPQYDVETLPFSISEESGSVKCTQVVDGETFYFRTAGNELRFSGDGLYYISRVYEQL